MGLFFEEYKVGNKYVSKERTITDADIKQFADLSDDHNPLHTDEQFVKENTAFGKCIAHGALIFAISTGMYYNLGLSAGTTLAFLGTTVSWKHPVYPGDTIHMEVEILNKHETSKPDHGVVEMQRNILNQNGDICMESTATLMVKREVK